MGDEIPGEGPTVPTARGLTGAVADAMTRAAASGFDPDAILAIGAKRHAKATELAGKDKPDDHGIAGLPPDVAAILVGKRGAGPARAPSSDAVALARVIAAVEAIPGYVVRLVPEIALAHAMGASGLDSLAMPGEGGRKAVMAALREGIDVGLVVIAREGPHVGGGPVEPPPADADDTAALARLGGTARRHGADAIGEAALRHDGFPTGRLRAEAAAVLTELGLDDRGPLS